MALTVRRRPGRAAAPLPAVPRQVLAMAAVLVLGSFMTVLDLTIVNVALPPLGSSFGSPLSVVQWVVTGYTLALAAVLPVTGWAVDRWGGRRVFLVSVALFTAGSGLCGVAWDAGSLIAFRVVQGAGGGLIVPVAMTLLLRAVPAERKGTAMAVLSVPVLIGPMAGPVLGGILTDALSWRWIFLVNLPVGALTLVLGARLVPGGDRDPVRRPLDLVGLLTLSPGLAALLYGLTVAGEGGSPVSPGALLPVLAGGALVAAFVVRALRADRGPRAGRPPLLDLRLFSRPAYGRAVAAMVPFSAAYFGLLMAVPLYWQQERGLSGTATGLLMAPQFLCSGTVMQLSGRIADRLPARRLALPGALLAASAYLAVALMAGGTGVPHGWVVAALGLLGVGVGLVNMPLMTAATRGLSGPETAGGTTALNVVSRLAAGAGTALFALLLSVTDGFGTTLLCGAGLMALTVLGVLRLPGEPS
ncbi:DHA2 family efflux MFS transporter permease subunit [Streptomyces sp. MJP52]|uniref:DHA2 family efflux MFS transporter permease subunit n=1 Tax=Streptomyces sp. MJP52 TaxID=2940555 RepID=UPI002475E492|nr:DHA2 family efflux MFS transporter permease subunit [Streptomyces sp. MJP52]MDH6224836.1 EmrB/QacA subfamily drug resistance transporter [Streptomyces sp. MJP52]